jgi:hypothetical protein
VSHRRQFLSASGALAAGVLLPLPAGAQEAMIHELAGEVRVNGQPATRAMRLGAGDSIYTGRGGRIAFVIGGDAVFMRPGSELRLESRARSILISAFRLVQGALGATFSRGRERDLIARTVTVGIRGTGVYLETQADETYACTCFGATELKSTADASMMESVAVVTGNHVARRIYRDPRMGMRVAPAAFERHTNEEIAALEKLAGRGNPFKS